MKGDSIRDAVVEELTTIAPDIDRSELDPDADLRDEYDLDSMDAFNLIAALHKRLGVDIPDADAADLATVNQIVDYLRGKQGPS